MEDRWKINNSKDIEDAINILHRRSMRDKTEIDLLTAKVDLLMTPWWRPISRHHAKRWITIMASEREEE